MTLMYRRLQLIKIVISTNNYFQLRRNYVSSKVRKIEVDGKKLIAFLRFKIVSQTVWPIFYTCRVVLDIYNFDNCVQLFGH